VGAGAGLAALSLVGCGGSDDGGDGGSGGDASGLIYQPQDSTSRAKAGGTFRGFTTNDPPSMDPLTSSAFQVTSSVAYYAYPRMLKWKAVKFPEFADGSVEGELAESHEVSGDKLQVTFKLRQGLKWDNRAPTNSRVIDAQDVVFSWEKFSKLNGLAADFASVESVTAPDNRTVVVKTKVPDSSTVQLFTAATLFYVLPREAEGGFDPRGEVRGHGPYMLTEVRPSALYTWSKNPNYYVKDRPFYDKVELPVVSEYATRLSQFKAGNIWNNVGVTQDDIVPTKRDVPALLLRQGEQHAVTPSWVAFGYEGDSPFKDIRVRQALIMSIDRELLVDVISNREKFRADGLDIPVRYHTVVGAGWEGYWIDPLNEKEFGPNAKYLKYNPDEAKKLLSAAGKANGVDFNFYYSLGAQYGAEYTRVADIFPGMLAEAGFRANIQPKEYSTDYLPNIYFGYVSKDFESGKVKGYNGMVYGLDRGYPTVASQMMATQHKDGPRFRGMTPTGSNAHLGDPKINTLAEQIRGEFDLEKQQSLVHELIKYEAQQCYYSPATYSRLNYGLDWPVIGNLGVYRSYNASNPIGETTLHWWMDNSKPPVGQS
jgi:ABC-type transport system substrate-binding protein